MRKEIKGKNTKRPQSWGTKESPYESMVFALSLGKSEEEAKKAVKEFEESFSYLLICEYGRATPFEIDQIYAAEQKDGMKGFFKAVRKFMSSPYYSLFRDEED